jgi:NAD-dependent deacetylase
MGGECIRQERSDRYMDQVGVARAANILRSARRAVVLTGAGISRPSGIPDFRSDNGLWERTDPMEVASLSAFQADPRRFYAWFRPLLEHLLAAQPNPAHLALARLERDARLRAVVTQNIDGLHQRAGSREVYELHGHLRSATCLACDRQVPAAPLLERVRGGEVPRCGCGGPFKPDVVLFDEVLPRGLFWLAQRAIETCDALIVAGTSLEVYPVSDMPLAALRRGARIIIVNKDATYLDERADVVLHDDVAVALPAIVEQIDRET